MSTSLFEENIFGPVQSRRLGSSLGINLLPVDCKVCNFDCIYCECGLNKENKKNAESLLPTASCIFTLLDHKLRKLLNEGTELNAITFAGNGEPTMHPQFQRIVNDTVYLRKKYYPKCKVVVLSNGTTLKRPEIKLALKKADSCMMKLDSGTDSYFNAINQPLGSVRINDIEDNLKSFNGDFIVQSMFLRAKINGEVLDNTRQNQVDAWIEKLKRINPKQVVLYTVDRPSPLPIYKVSYQEMIDISMQLAVHGIDSYVVE